MKCQTISTSAALLVLAGSALGCARTSPLSLRVAEPAPRPLVIGPALPPLPSSAPVIAIACGNVHSCALLAEGRVACWGDNEHGELGPGIDADADVGEHRVPGAVGLIANGWRTCARLADGTHTCWGKGFEGKAMSFPPVEGARFILGAYAALLLRPHEQELVFWPQPGKPTPDVGESTYSLLTNLPPSGGVQGVAGSFEYLVVATGDGSLWCRAKPGGDVLCPGAARGAWSRTDGVFARQIVASDERLCVLRAAGDVRCAGLERSPPPRVPPGFQPIALTRRATAVAGSARDTCALLEGGEVSCWPTERGSGAATFLPAVSLPELGTVQTLAAGGAHTCALDVKGAVSCFGSNEEGQVSANASRTPYGSIRRVRLVP